MFGDTKAALLLAVDSILLATLASAVTGEKPLIADLHKVSLALTTVAFASIVAGLGVALLAIMPNPRILWNRDAVDPRRPMLFSYARVAIQDRDDYVQTVLVADPGEVDRHVAAMVHGKSQWAAHKFKRLYFAIIATLLGVCAGASAAAIEMITRVA
ncbi:Pycsar system effector family protein [Kocuria arenosa]|uniref:Pycsar system effector family protein n=1 Tax=Kocuria arenosa TaxID=3071446 RepID=UPI0034D530E0